MAQPPAPDYPDLRNPEDRAFFTDVTRVLSDFLDGKIERHVAEHHVVDPLPQHVPAGVQDNIRAQTLRTLVRVVAQEVGFQVQGHQASYAVDSDARARVQRIVEDELDIILVELDHALEAEIAGDLATLDGGAEREVRGA